MNQLSEELHLLRQHVDDQFARQREYIDLVAERERKCSIQQVAELKSTLLEGFNEKFETGRKEFNEKFEAERKEFNEKFEAGRRESYDKFEAWRKEFGEKFEAGRKEFDAKFETWRKEFNEKFEAGRKENSEKFEIGRKETAALRQDNDQKFKWMMKALVMVMIGLVGVIAGQVALYLR